MNKELFYESSDVNDYNHDYWPYEEACEVLGKIKRRQLNNIIKEEKLLPRAYRKNGGKQEYGCLEISAIKRYADNMNYDWPELVKNVVPKNLTFEASWSRKDVIDPSSSAVPSITTALPSNNDEQFKKIAEALTLVGAELESLKNRPVDKIDMQHLEDMIMAHLPKTIQSTKKSSWAPLGMLALGLAITIGVMSHTSTKTDEVMRHNDAINSSLTDSVKKSFIHQELLSETISGLKKDIADGQKSLDEIKEMNQDLKLKMEQSKHVPILAPIWWHNPTDEDTNKAATDN